MKEVIDKSVQDSYKYLTSDTNLIGVEISWDVGNMVGLAFENSFYSNGGCNRKGRER